MRLATWLSILTLWCPLSALGAQTAADSTAIRAAALDYIEGWFTGDPARMGWALHAELVKRIVVTDEVTGRDWIVGMGMSKLVEGTRRKFGTEVPRDERRTDVTILDIMGRAASVKVDAGPWVDYMHLVNANGAWKILNVLWETRQGSRQAAEGGAVVDASREPPRFLTPPPRADWSALDTGVRDVDAS